MPYWQKWTTVCGRNGLHDEFIKYLIKSGCHWTQSGWVENLHPTPTKTMAVKLRLLRYVFPAVKVLFPVWQKQDWWFSFLSNKRKQNWTGYPVRLSYRSLTYRFEWTFLFSTPAGAFGCFSVVHDWFGRIGNSLTHTGVEAEGRCYYQSGLEQL